MEQVRLGIIGIGGMGSGHAANIAEGKVPKMCLTAVADIRESRLDWAKDNQMCIRDSHNRILYRIY